jgi:O-methyltransferase involved in polyketide biosynthesis
MFITLYSRALQSRADNPILDDPWAEEAIRCIDFDFGRLRVGDARAGLVAARAKQLDLWTARFLSDCPDATVLHLGCGLDSRVYRVNPPQRARWFDVDYPEVIEMRRRLYPERSGYRMIAAPLEDPGWLDDVPRDRPALMVAEGVTMYLTQSVMKGLLNRLVDHLPSG